MCAYILYQFLVTGIQSPSQEIYTHKWHTQMHRQIDRSDYAVGQRNSPAWQFWGYTAHANLILN